MTAPPLIDPGGLLADNIDNVATLLRFLEETAGNYGSRLRTPASMGENGYSPDGWAGMQMVLALARESLDHLARSQG